MVVGQILSHKRLLELAGRSREKDRYLMDQLGIDEIILRYPRGIFSRSAKVSRLGIPVFKTQTSFEVESLYQAAEILGKKDPKFITMMNLAALIFSDWTDPTSKAKKVHHQLKKLYFRREKDFWLNLDSIFPTLSF